MIINKRTLRILSIIFAAILAIMVVSEIGKIDIVYAKSSTVNDMDFLTAKDSISSKRLIEDIKVNLKTAIKGLKEGVRTVYQYVKDNNLIERAVESMKRLFYTVKESEFMEKIRATVKDLFQ